jgi:hypothetical protein
LKPASEPNDSHAHVASEHEWLALGAIGKCRSIVQLTTDLDIHTVLEIGAGTGAILEQLDRLGFADEYAAVEPSAPLYDHIASDLDIGRLKHLEQATLEDSRFASQHFDLAILSHVIEHVPNPAALVEQALGVADFVLIEVPLEATPLGNVRATLRTRLSGARRNENSAGHIQFFSKSAMDALTTWCGARVVRSRLYVPYPQMNAARKRGTRPRRAYANVIWAGAHLMGERVWARLYYGHYAVLIQKVAAVDVDTAGQPLFFANDANGYE